MFHNLYFFARKASLNREGFHRHYLEKHPVAGGKGISYIKRFVYQHLYTDLATALRDEAESAGVMLHSQDFKEGVKAFLEKRAPKFSGR